MSNFIILTDSRQQKEQHIIKEFDKQEILHIRTGLPSADYMALRYNEENGFYLDYSVLIDTKKDIEEIAANLCNTQSHDRVKREIFKGQELGAKEFIFLINGGKVKTMQDLENWSSKRTKVTGKTLCKVMQTMKAKYGVRFIFCERKRMGERIIELLNTNLPN